ncbi:acyl-CoA dehydrogenase family protein [Phenylobacterium sp.]|uniref:acyl-CoA dehydrogenase family protein n=1 Tax=Phenylobacterium sp. TaxID=1871053 RepID=UPI00289C3FA7|nr:acyl-CoA dehydrogenase family protein [Phenylobacterium sp.]
MDLSYSEVYEEYRRQLREFLAANWPLPEDVGSPKERVAEFQRRATEAGYLFRHVPRKYGGSEQPPDFLKGEIIKEEFRRVRAPTDPATSGVQRIIPVLLEWGTEAQKDFFIPRTMSGEISWTQGYSEPNAGSDLAALTTRAELIGDRWVINGQKIWSSNAYKAQYMNALIRTEQAPRHQGISYMLIDLNQPGVEIRRIKQITGEAEFCEVFFTNAEAPADAAVGGRGNGWAVSRTTLRYERSGFRSVDWMEAVLRRLVATARETIRDGRPAIEDQDLRRQIARVQARLYAMRYSAYRDLSMEAAGEHSGDYLLTQKLYLTDTIQFIDRLTRDLLADDYLLATPGKGKDGREGNIKWIEHSFHTLKVAIAGGSSNIQRNIIGERVLGLPRDHIGVAAREDVGANG